jgi:hypothetical protein
MRDALEVMVRPDNRVIRVIGEPVQGAGLLIEVTMDTAPLRRELLEYALRILYLSLIISLATASLLFLAVQRLIVGPIRRVIASMADYAQAPEDARRIITPSAGVTELREAEETLAKLQTDLTGALGRRSGWRSSAARWRGSATICATSWPRRRWSPTGSRRRRTRPCGARRRNWWGRCRARSAFAKARSPSARPRSRRRG